MHLRRPLAAAAAGLALVSTACASEALDPRASGSTTTSTSADDSTTTTRETFTPDPIDWDDCGGVDCATLEVPLDYADPNGERIEIYAARSPATGDRKGALFVNPGGPGASAADLAEVLSLILPREITEHFDIVGVDPRGVGGSTPIDCGVDAKELYTADPTMEDDADKAALLEVSQRYVDDCATKYPELLPHVSTREVAQDMDSVRAAMGEDQLSFLGFSYGTAIGQVYADLFPQRVRSMVLDGLVELGRSGLELADEQAAGFEMALSRFVADCDGDDSCAVSGQALEAVEEVLAAVEEPGGIVAPGADRPAGPGEASLGIGYALYSEAQWGRLGDALADARDGDGSALVDLADAYLDLAGFEVYFAVNCMDMAWPRDDVDAFFEAGKAAAERSPHFGEALVTDYIRCVNWPVAPTPLEPTSAPGTPPILVISTTGDPATPYEAGVAVADRLENGVLVTNQGEGHTVIADGKACIDDLVVAYLVDDVIPEDGTTCS